MTLAWHTLIDFHDCDAARLADTHGLRDAMLAAILEAGGTYVTDVFHEFSPHGLSAIVVIAESHVALHTWPEHRFAALDIFSCTQRLDQELIAGKIGAWLGSEPRRVERHERGRV
ncbi:MAG: S-adenosylmethionine decarboxylase [Akkermansiaceae bacterium]|nr:S-adenosylmethionine decarboxylase [Akkermansiaceae bacterium]